MTVRVETLRVGDKVMVRTRDIGVIEATVDEVYRVTEDEPEGVKNGQPGICYSAPSRGDGGGWCYENQIVRKIA